MNFKFLIAWCSVWLPLTIGQGCPYSRTVVPGDAKRYIEMVHNIAHERHCAPGTEFDPASCECSLLSSIPWATGLAFIDGLATAYPELANMPLDVLHKELLHLTSQNMYPLNVPSVPSSFEKTTGLNNQGRQQTDIFSPSSINTQQILELFQYVRPEDIPTDVLNDLDRLLLLENGFPGSNIFQTQNTFSQFPSRHNNERTFTGGTHNEHMVGTFRDMHTQNQLQNSRRHSQNPPLSMIKTPTPTTQSKVNFHEIKDLIESFQNLMTTPTLKSNIITRVSQTHSTQKPTIQKQSALDNFQSIASSILKAFPTTKSTTTRPSVLGNPIASPPISPRTHSPSSRAKTNTQNIHQTRNPLRQNVQSQISNNPDQHLRSISQPITPRKIQKLSQAQSLVKQQQLPQVVKLPTKQRMKEQVSIPSHWIYWGTADDTKVNLLFIIIWIQKQKT